jgi:DNA-binding transcriptional LysR family regulator
MGRPGVPGRLDEGRYPVVKLGDDVLQPLSAPDVSGRPLFQLERSAPLPVLDYSDASGVGRILRARLPKRFAEFEGGAGPGMSVVFSAHNASLLKIMAVAGRGLAWLPESFVHNELQSRQFVPAGGDEWLVTLEVPYQQNAEMAPTSPDRAFASTLR